MTFVIDSLMTIVQFPSEIMHEVVRYLGPWLEFDRHDRRIVRGSRDCFDIAGAQLKTGLAACSLTCRYWATAIRPVLFSSLVLRSADDFDQMIALVEAPTSPAGDLVSTFVREVGIELDGSPQRPWLHHLRKLSVHLGPKRPPRLRGMEPPSFLFRMRVVGDGHSNLESIHLLPFQDLPRSLPHIYPALLSLRLENLRLRPSRDLIRLVSRPPRLFSYWMERVSFPGGPRANVTLLSQIRRTSPTMAVVSRCGDGLARTQLSLAIAALPPPKYSGVHDHVWDIAFQAVAAYTPENHDHVNVQVDMEDVGINPIGT